MGNTGDGQPAGHHRVDALLDSGSSLSFVHPEAIENLPGVVYTQGPKFRLRLGDGAEKLIDGQLAHLVVRVRACDGPLPCVPHTFRVWDRLPYGCILGYDFLRLHGVCCEPTPSGLHLEYKGLDTREAAKAALDALSDGFDPPPRGGGRNYPGGAASNACNAGGPPGTRGRPGDGGHWRAGGTRRTRCLRGLRPFPGVSVSGDADYPRRRSRDTAYH